MKWVETHSKSFKEVLYLHFIRESYLTVVRKRVGGGGGGGVAGPLMDNGQNEAAFLRDDFPYPYKQT